MRHQVERLKHVAPRQGVKLARALTAAFVAIGMMVTGSVVLSSSTANADSSKADGSLCTPQTIGLGDDTSDAKVDSGVATYVGGNMYVGANTQNYSELNGNQSPDKSYAVEAEGLTLVNGKLAINSAKKSWNRRGFRFGVVGFGGQYRPKPDSDVLVVAGNNNLTMKDNRGNFYGGPQDVSALGGWTDGNTARGFVNTNTGDQYKAKIKGNTSVPYNNGPKTGEDATYAPTGSNYSRSVYDAGKDKEATSTDVTYNNNVSLSNVSVNGETKDYSNFLTEKVQSLSNKLLKVEPTGKVAAGTAPAGDYSRYHYRYMDPTETGINKNTKYDFHFVQDNPGANQQKEKLITFTGENDPSLEVFDVDASMLNSEGYSGISFAFTNISDTASVVINVTGSNAITFNNGWRFWWKGQEISNGYVTAKAGGDHVTDAMRKAYSNAAQKIMWNFAKTSKLTIKGGWANSGYLKYGTYGTSNPQVLKSDDDPAAAMLGSIMVPYGSFESHVTTNGRVYVGGDFSMYNPTNIGVAMAEGATASVIDMDQERHNLPWNGQLTTSCAAIKWNKVDAEGGALKGTSWTVYGTWDNAVSNANPIATVADGGWNDADNADNGSVTLGSLAKNATYYVRESGTGSSKYAQNTNIYRIVTQDSTDTVSTIDKVYTNAGDDITDKDDTTKQLHNGAIVNVSAGASITWSKVDAEDQNALLAGSTWELTKKGNPAQSWTITDDDSDSEIANIVVKINGTKADSWNFTNSTPVSISYVAVDKNGKELATKVQWKSERPAVAGIAGDGTQLQPYSDGTTNIVFTAGDKTLTFPVAVNGVTVESRISIEGYTEGQEISLEQGKTMPLKATVAPAEGNTVNWSSSNTDDVSVSPSTGTAVTVTAKNTTSSYVTITATEQRGGKKASLKIKVTEPMVSVYFKKSNVQWNNYWLKYRKSTDGTGWSGDVQSSSACGDYVRFQLPKSSVATGHEFYLGNAQGWNLTANNIYQAVNKSNFRFTGNSVQVVETYNNYQGSTVPSGCTVTSAYVENRSRRSAVKNAVFYDQPVVRAITSTTDKAAGTKPDEDPKAGQLKVSNLEDGTYTLKETSAPNGFDASNAKTYTIDIANGQIQHSDLPEKVENPRLRGKVTWRKTTENPNELLSCSEWKLYKTKNFTWNNGNAEYTEGDSITPIATITDYVNSSEKTCSAQTEQHTDRDGDAGKFELVGLAWGEYQLVESKAPDGFNLDSTPHTFRIGPAEGSDVTGNWYTSSGFKTDSTDVYNADTAFTVNGGSITNTPGVVLPDTGGEGLNKMYAAGFLAVAIAVAGLALSLRRRQS